MYLSFSSVVGKVWIVCCVLFFDPSIAPPLVVLNKSKLNNTLKYTATDLFISSKLRTPKRKDVLITSYLFYRW